MKMKPKLFMLNLRKNSNTILDKIRSGPSLFSLALCAVAAVVIISSGNNEAVRDIGNYETGKVADRDITAEVTVSFFDEEATKAKIDAAVKQVPAVFSFSGDASRQILDSWKGFCDFTDKLAGGSPAARIAVDGEYPAYFSNETLDAYLSAPGRAAFRAYGERALNAILEQGVFSIHREDTKPFNPDVAELQGKNIVSYDSVITMANVREALGTIIRNIEAPVIFKAVAVDLLRPFVRENVFFSAEESQERIKETIETTAPVVHNIEKGARIIRKGFIITETEMEELRALHLSYPKRDPRNIIGYILLVLILYVLFSYIILRGKLILGKELNNRERYLLASIAGAYIIGALLLKNITPGIEGFPVSFLLPTALFIMILAVFMGARTAMIMALALPLGAYYIGAFDYHSYIIAIVSGAAASTVLYNAENRMSLIKAGLVIAAANIFAIIVVLLIRQAYLYNYPIMIFWAALNGIVSGMLTLGFLPPLEHALNAVTPFRLMELSDLNAPILRKLFTAAPGTYSHSLMVANLAEQACQDIEANALLARVGAYYHDIGKMDNPDYFVENQTDHNRHDEIAPRLSATIIRSHVKLGVEKALSLGLPKDVIAIIAEHHGNSIISWFYNKAAEQEENINSEDFTYPGTPPRSRESAVVMLADITEAAVRTLSKPTAGKIDKFIQQLFDDKIEHGQLVESELSFRDLEIIKKAFVRVLVGYYHSRIEYPKQKEESRNNEQQD
jgi:putative nucleotidyltransferase with HDIG domain